MATVSSETRVGLLLRDWRKRRRLTQLELALDTGISARHLSFVETGRSKPGREMVLRLSDELEIPFRERNQLLLAAGHPPAFPQRRLDDPPLPPGREAPDLILKGPEPHPPGGLDRGWDPVAANAPVWALAELVEIDPALLEPPINALRVGLHPRGLASATVDLGRWRAYFLERLARQVATTGDDDLAALLEEVSAYPAPEPEHTPGPD